MIEGDNLMGFLNEIRGKYGYDKDGCNAGGYNEDAEVELKIV